MSKSPGTALDVVTTAISKVRDGTVTMSDLLTTVAPKQDNPARPEHLPVPAAITEEERKALSRLPDVYGQVVPTERRALQPAEVSALVEEKTVLDSIKKMVEKRLGNIRITIFNHFDVEAEKDQGFDTQGTLHDKDGHYILDGTASVTPGTGSTFKRETRGGAPSLSANDLQALVDNPDFPEFTHSDYLAMTEQVRLLDENRFMLHLKKRPELVRAIAAVTKPGTKTASLNLRKVT